VVEGAMTGEMFLAYVENCLVPTLRRTMSGLFYASRSLRRKSRPSRAALAALGDPIARVVATLTPSLLAGIRGHSTGRCAGD
jgi:hypothetical protein